MILWLLAIALIAVYWAPTYLAWELRCEHIWHVALVNCFLGWTIIGWFVAGYMAWHDRPIPPSIYDRLRREQTTRRVH